MLQKKDTEWHHCITFQQLAFHLICITVGLKTIARVISNFICAISIFVAVKNNSIFLATEYTELLLNHGADVYAVNFDDKKPLDLASMKKGKIHVQNFK